MQDWWDVARQIRLRRWFRWCYTCSWERWFRRCGWLRWTRWTEWRKVSKMMQSKYENWDENFCRCGELEFWPFSCNSSTLYFPPTCTCIRVSYPFHGRDVSADVLSNTSRSSRHMCPPVVVAPCWLDAIVKYLYYPSPPRPLVMIWRQQCCSLSFSMRTACPFVRRSVSVCVSINVSLSLCVFFCIGICMYVCLCACLSGVSISSVYLVVSLSSLCHRFCGCLHVLTVFSADVGVVVCVVVIVPLSVLLVSGILMLVLLMSRVLVSVLLLLLLILF